MRKKWTDRINKAISESNEQLFEKKIICKLVNNALKEKDISGEAQIVQLCDVNKYTIPKTSIDKKDSLIFIQFSKRGHVAVVGAGKDFVYNPLYNGKTSTARVMDELRCKKSSEDYQFDVDSIIMVLLNDLDAIGYNKASTILKSRNGVEQFIGEYLSKNNVGILNYYQHWNYSKSVFELIQKV